MTARTLATLCAVGLLLVAGCSGFSGDATETPEVTGTPADGGGDTATPTATPSPTPTGSVDEFAYPDGASADGIDNVSALTDAHGEALQDSDVETAYRSQSWERDDSGNQSSLRSDFTADVRSDVEAQRALLVTNVSYVGAGRTQTVSLTESLTTTNETYSRAVDRGGNESYSVDTPQSDFATRHASISSTGVEPIVRSADWEATDVVRQNGTVLVRYEPTALTTDDQATNENAENVSGRLLVDERGVVHEARLGFEIPRDDGGEQVVRYSFDLALGDLTVEDPEWLDEAQSSAE